MYERIRLQLLHQNLHLILGSFSTGFSKNRIELIATIFADFLIKPDGRFKDVFQTVIFAILGKETVRVSSDVFLRVRERRGETGVFMDMSGGESDREGEGEKRTRMTMLRWEARRWRDTPATEWQITLACKQTFSGFFSFQIFFHEPVYILWILCSCSSICQCPEGTTGNLIFIYFISISND